MRTVDLRPTDTQFSRLVDAAADGEEIVIAQAGKPVAKRVAVEAAPRQRHLGRLVGKYAVPADFDAPLPDDLLDAFEGR